MVKSHLRRGPRTVIETLRDGLVVVGTAHISATSVAEVEQAIRQTRPQRVLVELDPPRLAALRDPEAWQRTDIFKVLRERKQHLFLLQVYLASMQARMGRSTGVSPGAELLRAVQVADEVGAQVVLIDRNITVTLRRGFGAMGFWAKLRMAWHFVKELLPEGDEGRHIDIEEMLKSDAITQMTEEFARFAPDIKVALIDERDAYMASHVHEQAAKGSLVAVVGAGHLKGIKDHLAVPDSIPDRAVLDTLPPKRLTVGKVLTVLIPLALAVLLAYFIVNEDYSQALQYVYWWIGLHVFFAGLGGALALGHPLAFMTGGLTAPFTSALPVVVKSGWLAAFVQAKRRKPTVADFQAIKRTETMGQFFRNPVVRILSVAAMTNLGSWAAKGFFLFYVVGSL